MWKLMAIAVLVAVASPAGELYDVVVVGGGPAGIGAALAAAKAGAKTALVERDSVVGGTTVQAKVCDMGLFSAWKRQIIAGPAWDLVTNAVAAAHGTLPDFAAQRPDKWMESCVRVDPEVYSRLAEETLCKAGVTILLGKEVSSVTRTADGWDTGFAVGRQIVDATGNATVAALAGARRVKSPDGLRQPGSFFFWISSKGAKFDATAVERAFRKAVADGELLPTDVHVGMSYFIRKGGGSGCYIPLADNSTPEARADTNRRGIEARDRVLAFIRRQPGLENVSFVSSAREVGVRETYRVVGEKTISERAYLDGVVEEDALCWSYWMVDAHSAKRSHARLVFHKDGKIGSVPLGAMLPKGVGGMLVAGRAVSSDHGANSALRVQASCMAMGQAAGVVAALAAARRCDPREVPLADIKASLSKIGHIVPVLKTPCMSGTAKAASAIKAYSMLTHDGRRLVSHVEGTNTVFELVPTNRLPANLPPVREWTIYAVKSAHTDIGLHNSQYIQRHGTVRRIDEARRLIAADPDDSDPGAFRYVAEGAWFWGNYPQDRGEAAAMSVATNEIARGRLDVGVTCAGNHTHLYGFEELCRSIYTKRELEDRWGIKTRTMLMTDNPGISWSIVAPYAEAGVEHVLFSPNHWNPHPSTIWKMDVNRPWSRNNPDAGGGGSRIDVRWDSAIPMLFWWQAPQSAARLLVWTCPHYGRGGEPFGIITAWNKMKPMSESEPMMARQLAKMEARYPYDVWLFADYEDDEWPSTRQSDLFKKWNAKWKWPQLRTCGRLDEPFDRVKARWGDKIPTLRGEMTSGWLQHAACTPDLLARKMAADRGLARAEMLTSVVSAKYKEVPSYKEAYPAEDFRRAWDALIWNDEHSYGVSGYQGRRVFETWMQHRDWIERAEHTALAGIQRAIPGWIIHNGNPNPLMCRDGTTESRWYRVAVTNGVIYSIYDKELGRELLEGPANEFRYTRDNHKTWMAGDNAAHALGAEMVQRVWLASDEKKIILETTFHHACDLFNTNRYDRFGYMAFPFAVPQFRFAAQLNGPVIDPLRDQSGLTSDAYTAVRDWCAVENGEFGVALVMADSCLTEFGEIHPDKTCYGGPVKSSGIYPYLFTDWLQMHNPDGDSFNFRFRYVITSYSGTWQSAHIPAFAERALDGLDDTFYGCYLPLSRYDLSVDSPAWNVQLLTLKRAEDGRGLIARFREREGRPCRVTASQHLAPDAEYTLCNVIERDVRKLDGFAFDLAPFGYATIRIDAPSLRFATRPPDDSAYAYTGLITAPRAGHGEKDGQMYILWGAELSSDFDHYELWRDGKFLANVTNEAPNGVAYRVARYEDLGLPSHSRHAYRIRKVWKDGRKYPLGEPIYGLTRDHAK